MKLTITNCFHCWTEYKRETPATWVSKDGTEFYCDPCVRALQVDVASLVPIEQWRAEHGLQQPARPAVEKAKETIMEKRAKEAPLAIKVRMLPCKWPGCKGQYRATNKHPFCNDCQQHGRQYSRVGKAIAAGKDPSTVPLDGRAKAAKVARAKPKPANGNGHAKVVALPADTAIAPEMIRVELNVRPEWLDLAWQRLDMTQKARALATVLGE